MKTEVVYYSKTGNTEKVAKAIAHAVDTRAINVKDDFILEDFDLLFVGSGIYGGKPGKEIVEFANHLRDVRGREFAVFGTYGDNFRPLEEVVSILKSKEMKCAGKWGCKGRSFVFFNRSRPSKEDLKHAEEFTKGLVHSKK